MIRLLNCVLTELADSVMPYILRISDFKTH